MTRNNLIEYLRDYPADFAKLVGFNRLNDLNNQWIKEMVAGGEDMTLQAHRLSYKTTCVTIALVEIMILLPNTRIMFMRKTDADVKEVIEQVRKVLQSKWVRGFVWDIYGVELRITTSNLSELSTNLTTDPRGSAQLTAMGTGGSLTGKHFDRIFTDDIINIDDRISKASRERTKLIYQELQNIRNKGGRIFNTGTPWHKDDCFTLMPNIKKYDCYSTGIMSEEEIKEKRGSMTASLFSANYELKHIADEDVIFTEPNLHAKPEMCNEGEVHIDASYGGADSTAMTLLKKVRDAKTGDDVYYVFGKLWHKHIDDCLNEIIGYRKSFKGGKIICEDNADKGYLAKELREKGERVATYHETTNKFIKITSYLKSVWGAIQFVEGTDAEYIEQILDYNENAEHDDAPDSLASIIRTKQFKNDLDGYISPFGR